MYNIDIQYLLESIENYEKLIRVPSIPPIDL